MLDLVLLIAGFILFCLAALKIGLTNGRVDFGWAGLACWILTALV